MTNTKKQKKNSLVENESILRKIFSIPTDKLWVYPLFFGFLIRTNGMTASSIWHDEGYTMWLIRYNFIEIIQRTARDVHPPLYYLISKAWVLVLGNTETSIRFLSILFSLGIIYLAYKIVERLFNKNAAFWAGMLVALSPFMVRFAQEARMYGVVAFFTTLGTYFLVKRIQDKNNKILLPYLLAMTAAVYTQYYAFFVVMVHWIIVAALTPGFFRFSWKDSLKKRLGIFNIDWILAGLAPVLLFLPWAPIAYKQVTRVSASYWIRPEWINERTIPNSISQFLIYAHLDGDTYKTPLGLFLFWLAAVALIGAAFLPLIKKDIKNKVALLLLYGFLPMVLVFILSKVKTPVYQDRYFPFSAVAILAIWGIAISLVERKGIRILLGTAVILVLLFGKMQLEHDTNHQMKSLTDAVKKEFRPGDTVLSGELYTFLDSSYYLGYKNVKLISSPVDGYGESSLFYDKQDQYVVSENEAILASTRGRVIIIGKTGDKKYFQDCFLGSRKGTILFDEGNKTNGLKAVLYE